MAQHDDGQLPERVRGLAQPLVEALGLEVIEVTVGGPHSRPLVKVIVDHADLTASGGVDVDLIATLSRQLGGKLDEVDPLASAYTLEVTSPGADRPLREARDFARNLGREVRVERHENSDEPGEVTGALVSVDDDHVTLEVDGSEMRISFDELTHGKVVLPW